jgi:precorrin-2/cobalt-factor-2 C20-methyltransferase
MKVRTRLPQVRAALAAVGRLDEALLVEYGTWPQQRVRRLREVDEPACPYFSLVLVPGHGRRPGGAA